MGAAIVIGYGVVAVLGIALVAMGTVSRNRLVVRSGIGLLAAGAGAWILGPLGLGLGLLAFIPAWRRRAAGNRGVDQDTPTQEIRRP